MSSSLEQALQACLQQVEQGTDWNAALAAYPAIRSELEPLLETALAAMDAGDEPVPAVAAMRSRSRILARASELRNQRNTNGRQAPFALRKVAGAIAAVLMVLVSGAGLLFASAQSLPGERLYPVKRAAELATLRLSLNQRQRISLSVAYEHRRLSEIRQLLIEGQVIAVQFEGTLTARNNSLWSVEGIPVLVPDNALIDDTIEVSDTVMIEGSTTNEGYVRAQLVEAAGYRIQGVVESTGKAFWTVAGERFVTLPVSHIEDGISVGDLVLVTIRLEDGQPVADRIILIRSKPPEPPDPAPTATSPAPKATTSEMEDSDPAGESTQQSEDHVRIEGQLQKKEENRWRIDDTWVRLTSSTEIEGSIALGDRVRVEAHPNPSGELVADVIERKSSSSPSPTPRPTESEGSGDDNGEHSSTPTPAGEETEFDGVVQSIAGDLWTISGVIVVVNEDTRLEDHPGVGDEVRVRALEQPDGTLLAERIEVDD
ncbi:MAG: DUF5666 domain-containing protein [Anaerolineales bacterium]